MTSGVTFLIKENLRDNKRISNGARCVYTAIRMPMHCAYPDVRANSPIKITVPLTNTVINFLSNTNLFTNQSPDGYCNIPVTSCLLSTKNICKTKGFTDASAC
jgi:hypothetical protein